MNLVAATAGAIAATAGGAAPAAPEAVRTQAREIFAHIVGIESSIGKGKVPVVAKYLAERFKAGGFPDADIHILPLGETASLVVRYKGGGGRPIAFLAHMDVVTAKRGDWQRDPYTLTEENGFFYGRGTSDVKQEVALLTATFLRLKAEGFLPKRDLIIAFSGDEETAQATARDLVTTHRDLVDAEYALNGDGGGGVLSEATATPLIFYVQGAEKSSAQFLLTTHNSGGHSSQPRSDNAIYELADALKAVQGYRFPTMWNEWTLGDFKAASQVTKGPLGEAMARFAAEPGNAAAAAEIAKNPAFVGRIRTTCVATMLTGGHAENALPQSATATINCRIFPGTSAADVQKTLQGLVGGKVDVKQGYDALVSNASPMRDDVMRAVAKAVAASDPGAPVVPTQAAYATDGAVFRNAGIPTYGVGGVFIMNSEEFAHGLNERIRVKEFYNGLAYWEVLIKALAG
ncbi:MAG TPA: M20/M25/M40 family metallo-hydrolase [Steroidobacteraceae bacterium]|jgi:acetylornithine deacetylase/succinyl-diaminopimelate desuccinylase-like protein|nr:M20/M25/M40 family metallo-hydrolase [Steroidobacteraceae bacterium]